MAKGQLRMRDRNAMVDPQREKRKSEVLIAAQSLDNEVQNVKNLKRISIGSIDLLMDPELEYRVSASNSTTNSRKSWSSGSSSGGEFDETDRLPARSQTSVKEIETRSVEMEDSFEDSFDVTNAEYLSKKDEDLSDLEISTDEQFLGKKETESSSLPLSRNLSGVGSPKRGVENVPIRKPSKSESETTGNSSPTLTKNLLWVPANQHPNFKPKNYLELVQDTLHNIKLENNNDLQDVDQNNKENLDSLERLPSDFTLKHKSLVRRPSRLRKSYTEFEEGDDDTSEHKVEQAKIRPRSSTDPSRSVSLKDITEELTKISNNAGLTNSDAVTLARTLSMAGSFTDAQSIPDPEKDNDSNFVSAHGTDENEFASNMFMKHGFVIPARSSLRRSKFNTYRKRTSEGTAVPDKDVLEVSERISDTNDSEQSAKIEVKQLLEEEKILPPENNDICGTTSPSNKVPENSSVLTSPSTISDFQDIYDHYRQSSVDWENELGQEQQKDEEGEKLLLDSSKSEKTDLSHKKGSWSWFNSIGEKQKEEAVNVEKTPDDVLDDDFIKTTRHTEKESERLAAIRSNHSKNRHQPISAHEISKSSKRDSASPLRNKETSRKGENVESTQSPTTAVSDKRQRLEMKFVSLFKRKGKSKHKASSETNKRTAHSELTKKAPIENNQEKRKKKHDDGLSTFVRSSKKASKLKSESISEDRLRSTPHTEDSSQHRDEEDLPMLQPAVSVTSTKSNQRINGILADAVTESVRELDDDDSQDISGEQLVDFTTNLDGTDCEQKNLNDDGEQGPSQSPVLPPRKLRFEDVKRPEKPNAPIQFSDSAFGFPLPMLTVSTIIMFDHRLPINVERAIYRLSHLKLSDSKRELRQQVILSNFMYAYLNLVNHTLYMEQAAQDDGMAPPDDEHIDSSDSNGMYTTEHNSANGAICIPDI